MDGDGWNDWNDLGLSGSFGLISIEPTTGITFHRKPFSSPFGVSDEDSEVSENKMVLERKIDGIPVRKIYVSNIPKEATNGEVSTLFKQFGEVVNVSVSRKYNNNLFTKSTFGFVTFRDTEGAACALGQKSLFLRSRQVFVNAADSWHQPLVNPDGSVQYNASFGFNKNNVTDNIVTTRDDNESDDDIGAVGGIAISSITPEEAESCPISRLNDDCLEHVFSELPLLTKIIASKVCRRWQTVISNMCRNIERLSFKGHLSCNIVQTDTVQTILENVGPNLKEIVCDPDDRFIINKSFVSIVARYCKKLEVLEIANVEIAKRSLQFLSKQCPNLRKISFYACPKLSDQDLTVLISKKNSKLEEIKLALMPDTGGRYLKYLQPPMKHVAIDRCPYVEPEFLMLGLSKVKDCLITLSLKRCSPIQYYDFSKITNAVPKLKNLIFSSLSSPSNLPPHLNCVGQFTELQTLDLSNNCLVSDSIISAIVNGNRLLKSLNLCGRRNKGNSFTQLGIAELSRIETLEELNISQCKEVNDESLKNYSLSRPHIKKLICFFCENLGDKGAISILSSCKELEYFDIRNCTGVTTKTIEKALAIVKTRTTNIPLKLLVHGTMTSISDEKLFAHPLLHVDFTDNSNITHLLDDIIVYGHDEFCVEPNCECCFGFENYFDYDDDEEFDDDFISDSDEGDLAILANSLETLEHQINIFHSDNTENWATYLL